MFQGTTILAIRHGGKVVVVGDGQVSLGQTVMKHSARKVRKLHHDKVIAGAGDVIEPDDDVIAIGSGGNYALAAARVLVKHTQLDARTIAEEAMLVAAGLCVYTNDQLTFEELA